MFRRGLPFHPYRRWPLLAATLLLACLMQACLQPVEGDFPNRSQGLEDDELLCVLRIPASAEEAELATPSLRDSIRFANYNQPLFKNVVQSLLKRILNGDVSAVDEYPGNTPVPNARERLIQMGGSGQNLDPLLRVAELYVVVKTGQPIISGRPVFIRLVWRDPLGREADRGFVGLRLDTEGSSEFLFGERFPSEFAKLGNYYTMPVYLRTNFREYAIRSIAEAGYVHSMVFAGQWNEFQWEGENLNISGRQRVQLDPETVAPLAGFYKFHWPTSTPDSLVYVELFLTAENDYLVADWGNRSHIEKILPSGPMDFFSSNGEIYWFEITPDSLLALFVVVDGDTLGSYQNPVF